MNALSQNVTTGIWSPSVWFRCGSLASHCFVPMSPRIVLRFICFSGRRGRPRSKMPDRLRFYRGYRIGVGSEWNFFPSPLQDQQQILGVDRAAGVDEDFLHGAVAWGVEGG